MSDTSEGFTAPSILVHGRADRRRNAKKSLCALCSQSMNAHDRMRSSFRIRAGRTGA